MFLLIGWSVFHFFTLFQVIVTIHDPIHVKKDADKAELKEKCQQVIYSVLPPIYHNLEGTNNCGKSEKKKN